MPENPLEFQLKEACQMTGACWAAWVEFSAPDWKIQASYKLDKAGREALQTLLAGNGNTTWLNGAVSGGRSRYKGLYESDHLKCSRLFVFPAQGAVLVGANELTPEYQRTWRLVAAALGGISASEAQSRQLQDALQELQNTQQELQARISAQQAAENRLVQATKLAAVGEMAAGVAHELNNPLTSVVGFSELVLEDLPANSPQRKDMEVILREARRARDVVRRLLDFSRRSESVRASTSVNDVIEDTLALMNHLLHTGGVDIHLRLAKSLPWVVADRNQLKQVFLNLFHNALNAMPDGGNLWVTTKVAPRYGVPHVSISIRDSGVGISPENLQRIFEPFFTTRAGQGGTGLGLSVTYGIISEHGGAIEAESTPGVGSTFTVWLPIEAA